MSEAYIATIANIYRYDKKILCHQLADEIMSFAINSEHVLM